MNEKWIEEVGDKKWGDDWNDRLEEERNNWEGESVLESSDIKEKWQKIGECWKQ